MPPTQRLELTWIGKGEEPQLEPRILIEDPDKSYGEAGSENMLIHGDNLLALKALEQEYAGKVKCIYIDPPYNTGSAFEHYDDGVEHSLWLNLLVPRLDLLYKLLSETGVMWVSIDDREAHYLKLVLDEKFGRTNFITSAIWKKVDSPNDNKSAIAPDHEYVLCYAKNKSLANFFQMLDDSILDAYKGPGEDGRYYRDRLLKKNGKNSLRSDRPSMYFSIKGPDGKDVFPVHDDGKEARWAAGLVTVNRMVESREIIWKERDRGWTPYTREYAPDSPSKPYPTIWTDVDTSRQAKAHQKELFPVAGVFATPKPEKLIERIFNMSTSENDLVLDSFLGSGTTAAVAHKMGRRWIGIELGEHANTHCLPRLKKVVDGLDEGGISKAQNWKGGGGFKFYNLAPSLLRKDDLGQWVIDERYNADQLAAAMAKHEGYTYAPDTDRYWKQAYSTENDYLYTTTQLITPAVVDHILEQLGPEESLLICCKAYQKGAAARDPRINLHKIPAILTDRCEFGKDDYSLNIVDAPKDEDAPEFVPAGQQAARAAEAEELRKYGKQKDMFD
jgi:adenine-specific DNA-methyltransferase